MRQELVDGVLLLTLDRPEVLNALDDATLDELLDAWARAAATDVRAVVLTGAGRAFCAGADLTAPSRAPDELAANQRARYNANALAVAALDRPVVAAVNGHAIGAGLALACAADVRIASDRAAFRPAFAAIGAVPDAGASWSIPRLIGHGRALDWFCSSRSIDAAEALAWGLVTEVVARGDLLDRAMARASELATLPGRAVALTKALLGTGAATDLAGQLEREAEAQRIAAADPARADARRAAARHRQEERT